MSVWKEGTAFYDTVHTCEVSYCVAAFSPSVLEDRSLLSGRESIVDTRRFKTYFPLFRPACITCHIIGIQLTCGRAETHLSIYASLIVTYYSLSFDVDYVDFIYVERRQERCVGTCKPQFVLDYSIGLSGRAARKKKKKLITRHVISYRKLRTNAINGNAFEAHSIRQAR